MIEGLKVDVPSHLLRERFSARARFHQERADFYAVKLKALSEAEEADEAGPQTGTSYLNNAPRQQYDQSRKSHLGKRDLFTFLAEHVVEAEVYRLAVEDLHQLELS